MKFDNKIIVILGPTAVGKTKFASLLAHKFSGEIISADSRQVYIGMDIGTGKDLEDYTLNNHTIKTHLIDVVKPQCEFNLYIFSQLFKISLKEIQQNNNLPFLVGGTGMYLSSVLQNYNLQEVDFNSKRAMQLEEYEIEELQKKLKEVNPKLHNTTDLVDRERLIKAILIAESKTENQDTIEINPLVLGISDDREIVKERIRERLKSRLKNGMIEEVEKLLTNGISHERLRFFGLEYKFLSMYLTNELNYNDMYQKLASAIIQFSKRQMTWFRKIEKEGVEINWLKNNELNKAESMINKFLA